MIPMSLDGSRLEKLGKGCSFPNLALSKYRLIGPEQLPGRARAAPSCFFASAKAHMPAYCNPKPDGPTLGE